MLKNIEEYKNYFCEQIPYELALKLKDKGADFIDVDDEVFNSGTQDEYTEYFCYNTYSEVFDWFLNKGISISIHKYKEANPKDPKGELIIKYAYMIDSERGTDFAQVERERAKDWFEEANKAIDKALFTLEQENKRKKKADLVD